MGKNLCVPLCIVLVALGLGCSELNESNADSRFNSSTEAEGTENKENMVIYLDASNGQPVSAGRDTRSVIRLMIRNGNVPTTYSTISPGDRIVDEGGGFRRTFPKGKPYQKGILHFNVSRGVTASVWEPPSLNAKDGFIQIDKDTFLQYTYFSEGNAEHKRISQIVLGWYDESNP